MSSEIISEVKLGDYIVHKKGFAFKSSEIYKDGQPIVKVTNFTGDSINMNNCFFINKIEAKKYLDYQIYQNDIIIATVGSWPNNPNSIVGKVIRVPKIAEGSLLNQNAVRLRSKNKINQLFLYYRLRCKDFSDYLISGARGSANQASISLEDIFKFKFKLPSIITQIRIAALFSSLDDKIELNRQNNQTLEGIAQTLFKEMCVPKGVELPEGWRIGKLGEVLEIKYGKDHKHLEDGNIPVYGSGGIMRYANKALYEHESILIPRKGTLSNLFYINKPFWSVDTMFYTKIKNNMHGKFLFLLLKTLNLASMNVGSAVPSLTTQVLNNIEITLPPDEIIIKFDDIVTPFFTTLEYNEQENQTLCTLRDSLLPKLMKWEIEI